MRRHRSLSQSSTAAKPMQMGTTGGVRLATPSSALSAARRSRALRTPQSIERCVSGHDVYPAYRLLARRTPSAHAVWLLGSAMERKTVICVSHKSLWHAIDMSLCAASCRYATSAAWRSPQQTFTATGPTPTAFITTARSASPPTASGARRRSRPSSSAWPLPRYVASVCWLPRSDYPPEPLALAAHALS